VSSKKDEPKQPAGTKSSGRTSDEIVFMPSGAEKAPKGDPRYRDPANPFNTWGGRGKRPEWLRKYLAEGKLLAEFEIEKPEE
jgi:DNA-binding protein H-NS